MSKFPLVPLSEVLKLHIDPVPVDPVATYPISGVYSFGKGLLARSPIKGSGTTYKVLHRLHTDDFVLSQLKAWEGALARVTPQFDGWFLSTQFPTFRAVLGKLEIKYLEWYCKQSNVWAELRSGARGMGARRDSVSPGKFLSIKIPLPTPEEQRRIVARIEEVEAKLQRARDLRKEAINDASVLLDTQLDEVFKDVIDSYEEMIIEKAGGFVTSGPRGWGEYYNNGGDRRLIRVENVWNRELDLSSAAKVLLPPDAGDVKRSQVQIGDVLVTITGAIGRVGVVKSFDIPCHVSQHVALIRPPKAILSEYLYWFLRSPKYGRSQTEGKKYGGAKPGINLTNLRSLRIPAPSHKEQQQIIDHLDSLQAKVDSLKAAQDETKAELEAMLPSLLDRAFKGEL